MTRKRILFISFYFKPDLSAGSFRSTALVEELLLLNDPALEIDVITTFPNRYAGFSADAKNNETIRNLTVHRILLPSHKSGMLDQAKAFIFFAKSALRIANDGEYDLIFSTSSRLMTAVLGSVISYRMKVPLYLDIRDIFSDTIKDVLPGKVAFFLVPIFSFIERLSFRKATRINIVSRGFEPYFKSKYPDINLSYFTNGIDEGFVQDFSLKNGLSKTCDRPLTVLYAGNIGEGQGLHLIVPFLAKHFEKKISFKVFGGGGRLEQLRHAIEEQGISNVVIFPPVSREVLIREYCDADVLFLHLNEYDAFKKVLPSKIFEYSALGKPIWAGVGGYAANFLIEEVSNVAVFHPCNVAEAIEVFEQLTIKDIPRDSFVKKFQRKTIMKSMAIDLLSLLQVEKVS